MGTWVDLSLLPPQPVDAAETFQQVEATLRAYERDYYAWAPGELARLNTAIEAGESLRVSPELADLLGEAQRLSALSDGYFEPGLGALVELWGFHSSETLAEAPPTDEAISRLLHEGSAISTLRLHGLSVQSDSRSLKLDLGGIAKGASVDAVIVLLEQHGISHALVNAGGDLRVAGRPGGPAGARPWRVGVKHPRGPGLLGIIELASGEAAFTSGDYERYFEHGDKRFHHILDPLTGYPVSHTQAVTVIAADGVTADAAATALFVAGPKRWREIADALGVDTVLRVDDSGAFELTEQMASRLRPATSEASDIMTTVP